MEKEARRRNSKIFKRKGRKIWTVPLEGGYKKRNFKNALAYSRLLIHWKWKFLKSQFSTNSNEN
jgi:hypothetical protein